MNPTEPMTRESKVERLVHRVRGRIERGERITPEDCRGLFDLRDLNRFSQLSRIARERRYGTDAFFTVADPVEIRKGDGVPSVYGENGGVLTPQYSAGERDPASWVGPLVESVRTLPADVRLRFDPRLLHAVAGEEGPGEFLSVSGGRSALIGPAGGFANDPLWGESAMTPERWLALHNTAHAAGRSTDAGVHYHDDADPDALVEFMSMIRDLQDLTGGFRSIVPIPFTLADEHQAPHRRQPSAAMTLRITAILRLFFDGIDHVVTPVRLLDPEISFVALSYGADTIDTTISPSEAEVAPGESGAGLLPIISPSERRAEEDLLRLIEERIVEARFRPVPVDPDYRRMRLVESAEN